MRISPVAASLLLGTLLGCDTGGPGAVGAPCNTAEDCVDGLICDEHNNQGSCQEPHGHSESDTSDDTGSDSDDSATSTTSDPMTSGTTETPDETTGGEETDDGSSTGSTTGGESGESGNSELCQAFCGCMVATCGEYEAYPYADDAACMAACEAFEEATLLCFGGFCEQAANSEGTLAEHYCEHAWGELGSEKC